MEVIALSHGQSDFETPAAAVETAHRAALSPDIYKHLVYDGRKSLDLEPRLKERALTVNGASKATE